MIIKKPQTKAGPGRPRDPNADAAVLRTALQLFIEHGLEGASFDQIAKRAGVARTTIYRRWSAREDLLAEAMETAREAPERWLSAIDDVAPNQLIDWLIDALSEMISRRDYRMIVARLIGSASDSPRLMSVYWNNYLLPRRKMVSEVMDRARAAGLLPESADPELIQDLVGGAILYHMLIRPGHRSAAEMRAYIRKVFHQLGLATSADR